MKETDLNTTITLAGGGSSENQLVAIAAPSENDICQIHCALINARSVGNKAPHIIDLLTENELDVLVITETWLFSDESAKVNSITPTGYTTFSKARDDRRGGGVAVICRDWFKCVLNDNSSDFQSFEYFQLDILVKNKKFSLFPFTGLNLMFLV